MKDLFDKLMMLTVAEDKLLNEKENISEILQRSVFDYVDNSEKLKESTKQATRRWATFDWYPTGIRVYGTFPKFFSLDDDNEPNTLAHQLSYKEVFGWEPDFSQPYKLSKVLEIISETLKKQ